MKEFYFKRSITDVSLKIYMYYAWWHLPNKEKSGVNRCKRKTKHISHHGWRIASSPFNFHVTWMMVWWLMHFWCTNDEEVNTLVCKKEKKKKRERKVKEKQRSQRCVGTCLMLLEKKKKAIGSTAVDCLVKYRILLTTRQREGNNVNQQNLREADVM